MTARLIVASDYQGAPLAPERHAHFELSWRGDSLQVELDAPFYADPPPPSAAGSTDRLWEYEVAELFIAGPDERYFELELGPHGHHLALELEGVRRVRRHGLALEYQVRIEPAQGHGPLAPGAPVGRYRGLARIPGEYLPAEPARVNAYLIHGVGAERRYCAHAPVPGAQPDFHRLERFVPWPATL